MKDVVLEWEDYAAISGVLAINLGIGIYYRFSGGRQKTTSEFFTANHSMSSVPVGIALVVSFMSAITILGVSSENYTHGTMFFVINFSYLLATPVVCYGFLPIFYNLQATSSYEYLEKRFGIGARLTASILTWIQMLLYSVVVLYAPALALEATTGLPKIWSVAVLGAICTLYSCLGGIKAVLVTDVVQAILMFISLIIVIVISSNNVGGVSEIWKIAQQDHRIEFDNISLDPTERHTWWNLMIGGFCTCLSLYGVNQIQVQRLMSVRNLKAARVALWLNWPILTCLSALTCFSGIAIYSHYKDCDPKASGRIASYDMLMPHYIMETLSDVPGIPGLFVAGIFSASLSTLSATFNSMSAMTLEDYIKPLHRKISGKKLSQSSTILLAKLLSLLIGILCIGMSYASHLLGGLLQASLIIFGVVGGPLLGMFTLGMISQTATQFGVVTGAISSLLTLFWISFGKPRPTTEILPISTLGCTETYGHARAANITANLSTPLSETTYFYPYRISYMWYGPIGFVMTFAVGLIASRIKQKISRETQKELNPDLFFPAIANRIRQKCRVNNKMDHCTELSTNL